MAFKNFDSLKINNTLIAAQRANSPDSELVEEECAAQTNLAKLGQDDVNKTSELCSEVTVIYFRAVDN